MKEKKYNEAIQKYTEHLSLDPRSPSGWLNLGACYWMQRDVGKARACFEKSLEIYPEYSLAIKNLRLLDRMMRRGDHLRKNATLSIRDNKKQKPIPPQWKNRTASIPPQQSSTHVAVPLAIPAYAITTKFTSPKLQNALKMFQDRASLKDSMLVVEYAQLSMQREFDDLLCLNAIKEVDHYWYQVETVKRVLKYFRGRVLLCDEVGLGKTIEAGMLTKEYVLRAMVKSILILTPASLVSQWQEEMCRKFGIDFITTENELFHEDPGSFWKKKYIIASIHTAKGARNFASVTARYFDLVIVDEAHHLKNRKTLAWKLVNEIKKRFIFLLTATPVQNNLIELYNLITLLKPGQFKTEKIFRQEYLQKGNIRLPVNKEKLKTLLRDVIIRNTRSAIDLKLPKRFATTIRCEATPAERVVYDQITALARDMSVSAANPLIQLLLREAGSSPFALKNTLAKLKLKTGVDVPALLELIDNMGEIAKGTALAEIVSKNAGEKKVIFTQYLSSMDYVTALLAKHNFPFVTFRGNMTASEKEEAIERFKEDIPLLVSTESGGEGRNLQFCNTIINFDLPWNPMKIEQRIGRIHRIGQMRDVFIFNLSVRNTIEDHIIDIMDNKINMFEMVIGEIEPILGYLGEDREFEDIVMDIWLKSSTNEDVKTGFEKLGQTLVDAKNSYIKSKQLDKELFEEDYEA